MEKCYIRTSPFISVHQYPHDALNRQSKVERVWVMRLIHCSGRLRIFLPCWLFLIGFLLIKFKILLLSCKILNNEVPTYLKDFKVTFHSNRALRLSASAFRPLWNTLWNQLPVWIWKTNTFSTFLDLKLSFLMKIYS